MSCDDGIISGKDITWHDVLKKKLNENANISDLIVISKYRSLPLNLRCDFWQKILEVSFNSDPFESFDELYDLKEQKLIHLDCLQLIRECNSDDKANLQLLSDVESIITLLCKSKNIQYSSNSTIIHLLRPLLYLNLHRSKLYNILYTILSKYIPSEFEKNVYSYHLFRLLLFYHDPELGAFFDTKRIPADKYAFNWFATLFSSLCHPNVTLNVWDIYLQHKDPYFIYFLALVIVINARDQILIMNEHDKSDIIAKMNSFPAALEEDDVDDFCTLAKYYSTKTPTTFREKFYRQIFDEQKYKIFHNELCLHIECTEVLNPKSNIDSINFLIIDCRPLEQYTAGHLPSSYHLDANLMLNNPIEFSVKVQNLYESLKIANSSLQNSEIVVSNQHLCFLGTGHSDDEKYIYMVVSHFLQKHTQYVSVCSGGYIELHKALKINNSINLEMHNPAQCLACQLTNNSQLTETYNYDGLLHKFGRFSNVMKSTSAVVKEKMINYIKNEPSIVVKHVSSTDKVGKRYRDTSSIFTIDDEDDELNGEISSEGETSDQVNIITWIHSNANIDTFYNCTRVSRGNKLKPAVICIAENQLVIFVKSMEEAIMGKLYAKRPLIDIIKITSKRRQPEFITIKYGHPVSCSSTEESRKKDGSCVLTYTDRLIIEKAGDATRTIKLAIMKIIDGE